MKLCDFFVDGGPLAAALGNGYNRREEQVRMAVEVGRCAGGEVDALLADAKTGTGKSLAYLVPAALAGSKVVLSTATRGSNTSSWTRICPPCAGRCGPRGSSPRPTRS
jgi:ATP-dependent DNA helicase DinG